MIRPSRHDYEIDRSSVTVKRASGDDLPRFAGSRFNSDDAYVGTRIANGVAVALFLFVLVLFGIFTYQKFIQAEKAIRHSISAPRGFDIARGHYRHLRKYSNARYERVSAVPAISRVIGGK